jgi:TATA-binding protein-associated factor Taf7
MLCVPVCCPAADDRKGVLTVKGAGGEVQQHDVYLQDLPTVVESYKTLDDANLVKVTDIGQVRSDAVQSHRI